MSIMDTVINVDFVSDSDIINYLDDFDYIQVFSGDIINDSDRNAILGKTDRDPNKNDFYSDIASERLNEYGIILSEMVTSVFEKKDIPYDEEYIKEFGKLFGKNLDYRLGSIRNGISSSLASSLSGIDIAIIYDEIIENVMGLGIKINTNINNEEQALKLSYTCKTKNSASNLLALAKSIVNSI